MTSRRARAVAWLLGVVVVGALCGVAAARPGGGQSFSSGHSYSSGGSYRSSGGSYSYHSSGGSGGTSAGGAAMAIVIIIGVAFTIGVIAMAVNSASATTYTSSYSPPQPPRPIDLDAITTPDPDFSRAAFEDFVYRLYAQAQRARHDHRELGTLTPYLSSDALDHLGRRAARVDHVVIGSLRITEAATEPSGRSRIVAAIEANLAGPGGTTNVSERWTFVRDAGVRTRPPERTRALTCPNCNAPFAPGPGARTCAHCSTTIDVGRFDWTVLGITVDAESSVGYTLTGTVPEVGNDFPTLAAPDAQERLMQLRQDDPNVTWKAFADRVQMVYGRLNDAWNTQDLTPVRGLVTASLLQYLQFWIDEYKRQHLANKLEDAAIDHIALAKVTRDKWVDAITVRVYARGHDVTLDRDQRVVGGSRSDLRAYTEYWTFLRSSARKGPITTTPSCPSCGAPLAISDAGACTHCSAQIENASFDWTLSKIEQDDVYRG